MDAAERRRGADASARRLLVRAHLPHRLDAARRRADPLLARALPARLVAGHRGAARAVARVLVPRAAGRRADRPAPHPRRPARSGSRRADRAVADPGHVRDVRPAAHAALRVADVGDRGRARRGGLGRPPPLDRGGRAARVHGVRPPDRAAVCADRVRRRVALRARRRFARRCGSRGPAPRRCSSRSCRTTSRRCTCSATATASAATASPGGRSPAGRCGRTRCTSSRPGATTSTTSPSSPRSASSSCWCEGRTGTLVFCVATVAAPVVFFSVVPTSGDSALFFDRYMIPVTPAFLVLVCVGIFTIAVVGGNVARARRGRARRGPRGDRGALRPRPPPRDAADRRRLGRRRGAARAAGDRALRLDRNERRQLLRVRLRAPGEPPRPSRRVYASRRSHRVDDEACANLEPFLRTTRPRYGLWLFYAASPDETAAAERALGTQPIGGHYFAVRSRTPLAPRALVRERDAAALAWKQAVPFNRRVDELLIADRSALDGTCVPYGDLGDPGISPHWPPVKTTISRRDVRSAAEPGFAQRPARPRERARVPAVERKKRDALAARLHEPAVRRGRAQCGRRRPASTSGRSRRRTSRRRAAGSRR